MTEIKLSRERIESLQTRLSAELGLQGIRGEILLFGGAAMILGWHAREMTRDVDAVFAPPEIIRRAARKIAAEERVPEDWLNDAVKGFLDRDLSPESRREILQLDHLAVYIPPIEYLIATKAFASRSGESSTDVEDLKFLIRKAELKTSAAVLDIVQSYYPTRPLPAKVRFFVEAVFEETSQDKT